MAQTGIRHLLGGKKLGLDMERIPLSNNHKKMQARLDESLQELRLALIQAEREGRYSKAKKIRRSINLRLEIGLYLNHSWCGGCHNVLHNCTCKEA